MIYPHLQKQRICLLKEIKLYQQKSMPNLFIDILGFILALICFYSSAKHEENCACDVINS